MRRNGILGIHNSGLEVGGLDRAGILACARAVARMNAADESHLQPQPPALLHLAANGVSSAQRHCVARAGEIRA